MDIFSSFWKHHRETDVTGIRLAEETLFFQEKTKNDFIKITPQGTWMAVAQGARDIAIPNDPLCRRKISSPFITNPQDWRSITDTGTSNPPLLEYMLEAAILIKKNSSQNPVYFTIFNPITQAIQLAGFDQFKEHIILYPDDVKAGLKQITKNTIGQFEEYKKAGIDSVYYVTQHKSTGFFSPLEYTMWGSPYDVQVYKNCFSGFNNNMIHLHGSDIYYDQNDLDSGGVLHFSKETVTSQVNHICIKPERVSFGIAPEKLRSLINEDELLQLIDQYLNLKQENYYLTADCVLPVDFPDEQIAKINGWVKDLRKIKHPEKLSVAYGT